MPAMATVTIRFELRDEGRRNAEEYHQQVETEVLRQLVMLRGSLEGRRIFFANSNPYLKIEVQQD